MASSEALDEQASRPCPARERAGDNCNRPARPPIGRCAYAQAPARTLTARCGF